MIARTQEKHSSSYKCVDGKLVHYDIMRDVFYDVVPLNGVLGAINLGYPHDFGGVRQERAWRIIDLATGYTVAPISTKGKLKDFVKLWEKMQFYFLSHKLIDDKTMHGVFVSRTSDNYTITSMKKYEVVNDSE